jgi:hypothetical protein
LRIDLPDPRFALRVSGPIRVEYGVDICANPGDCGSLPDPSSILRELLTISR